MVRFAEPSGLSANQPALDRLPPEPVSDRIERRFEALLFWIGPWGIKAKKIRLKGRIGLPARETQADQPRRN